MESESFIRSFDGTELYVRSSGHGPALVFSDGLGCDGFIWRYLKPALKDRYRLIHWNYRGHGLSKAPTDLNALDVGSLRRDLLAVLDACDVDRAVMFGHSMGVQLILDFALEHQDRVAGLIPICGGYGRPLETFHDHDGFALLFPYLRNAVLRYPRFAQRIWTRTIASKLAYFFATTLEVNGRLIQRDDFTPYFKHLSSMDAAVFVRLLDGLCNHSVEDRLADIRSPTLIIAGERDTFTPAWLSHRMQSLIPKSELMSIPDGSHVVPIEIPDVLQSRIESFLDSRVAWKPHGGGVRPKSPSSRTHAHRSMNPTHHMDSRV